MEFSGLARQISLISWATPSLQRISIVPLRASPIAHAQSVPPSPSSPASRRLCATRLLNVLATFPPRLNNFLMVTVLVVSYLEEKPVAIGFSYRMEKLNDQDQTSVGCAIRRSHARSSRHGSGEPCDL